jgi:cellulose synthase operon protein B
LEKITMVSRHCYQWLRFTSRYLTALPVFVGLIVCSGVVNSQNSQPKGSPTSTAKTSPKAPIVTNKAVVIETVTPSSTTEAANTGRRVVSLPIKKIGAWSAIALRGVDSSRVLAFTVRADEMIVGAKLVLSYDYSPSLIEELSHLKVLINDRIAATEILSQSKSTGVRKEFLLDHTNMKEYNELRLNFIGHYTRQCEDPFHSSLWLTVHESTTLELTLAPKSMLLDLKNLPAPFLDKRETETLNLPVVLSASPTQGTIRAAGIITSWFALQAGARGAQFPVLLNSLPNTNAILLINGKEDVAGYKGVPGTVVSIQPNPNNPQAQLLIVNGATDADLAKAARSIALMSKTLTGKSVGIVDDVAPLPRKPYDAPSWIRTDRPMKFGELAKLEELRTQGYYPEVIRLNYRVPPDVFTWRTSGAPIDLKYRATRLPEHRNSALSVGLNNNFIDSIALNDAANNPSALPLIQAAKRSVRQEHLNLPPYAVGGRDQLQLGFSFDVIKRGECQNLPPDNLVASIDAESTIDFSIFPKFTALPNLAFFTQIGFPFTRLADLSETSVVMSDNPTADEISVYFMTLGRLAESTGYPALNHTLISPADLSKAVDKDLIVIGTAQNQKAFSDLATKTPMFTEGGIRKLREPIVSWRPTYRWEQKDIDDEVKVKGNVNISNSGNLVAMMGFESPFTPTRSVVFLYADKASEFKKLADTLLDPERAKIIQGDFVVVNDKGVQFTKTSETYYLGHLPWYNKFRWFLADNPILVAFVALFLALLVSAVIYRPLKFVTNKILKKGK